MIVYTKKAGDIIGEIAVAEKYMGPGRTYTFIKVVGLFMIVVSFMYLTGGLEQLLTPYLHPYFRAP